MPSFNQLICSVADIAFVDRADIKAYVGPPTLQARYEILRSCLQELMHKGILTSLQVQRALILVQGCIIIIVITILKGLDTLILYTIF